ncbi:hypothetical protein BGZ65_005936, partial [Modicella reniformis]
WDALSRPRSRPRPRPRWPQDLKNHPGQDGSAPPGRPGSAPATTDSNWKRAGRQQQEATIS